MASDLPKSHTDLPKISSRLPEHKSKRKSRRDHRHKSQSKNCIVGRQAVQADDHIDTKQEIQWVIRPTHKTYLDQLVGRLLGPPPPEAAFPMISQPLACQPILGLHRRQLLPWSVSPWSISPIIQFHYCCPFVSSLT